MRERRFLENEWLRAWPWHGGGIGLRLENWPLFGCDVHMWDLYFNKCYNGHVCMAG